MTYSIMCVCGEKVSIDASTDEEAVGKMVGAMDGHVAAREHPEVPKNLTEEQKAVMVKQQMNKE